MKRLSLSLLLIFVLHLAASEAAAQVQRLAIPPQSFSLTGKGASHDARAYCLDRHLVISDPVDFSAVLAGDMPAVRVGSRPPMTLRQAIDQKLIIVKGAGVRNRPDYSRINGTQLKFVSNTDEPITIDFRQTLAMGEPGSRPVNASLLAPVRGNPADADFRSVQDEVWRSGLDESRLYALDLLGPGALQAFQRRFNLPRQDGSLDDVTRLALAQVERQERAAFERQGFRIRRDDTDVPSIADNIRAFEDFTGRPRTGKLTEELRAALTRFTAEQGPYARQVLSVDEAQGLPADPSVMNGNPNVITFQKTAYTTGGSDFVALTAVMLRTANGPELWLVENGTLAARRTGEAAVVGLDNVSRRIAGLKLGDRALGVRSGIYKPGGEVSLQLGQKVIRLSESEMESFLSGTLNHPEVNAALAAIPAGTAGRPRLVIFRSPFAQARGGGAGGDSPLAQFGYRQHDPLQLALAFERRHRDKFDVFVVSDTLYGLENLERMPKLRAGSQVGLYVDDQFKYSTRIVAPIKRDLERADIKVLKVGDNPASQTKIFLFAGHRDEAYQQLVLRLADEGHFRDGIVALAVCGGGNCDAQFNSLLIGKSGARAVIFYNQEIKAQVVQDVILKFTELLTTEGAPNGNYHELWRRSVDAVERNATPNQRNEVRKLRDIIIQLSGTRRESSPSNAE